MLGLPDWKADTSCPLGTRVSAAFPISAEDESRRSESLGRLARAPSQAPLGCVDLAAKLEK